MCVLCELVGLLFKEVAGIETGIKKTENSAWERLACSKVEASKMLALKGFLSIFRKPSRLVVPQHLADAYVIRFRVVCLSVVSLCFHPLPYPPPFTFLPLFPAIFTREKRRTPVRIARVKCRTAGRFAREFEIAAIRGYSSARINPSQGPANSLPPPLEVPR